MFLLVSKVSELLLVVDNAKSGICELGSEEASETLYRGVKLRIRDIYL